MSIRDSIIAAMRDVASEGGKTLVEPFPDDALLLQCGLDSLDFAILVARLERDFGEDPFVQMREPVYPKTLSDFVGIYEGFFGSKAG